MLWIFGIFSDSKEREEGEKTAWIKSTPIDGIIKFIDPLFGNPYRFNDKHTKSIWEKCETTMHYVILYAALCKVRYSGSYRLSGEVIPSEELVNSLHFETVQKLGQFLKTLKPYQLEVCSELHKYLDSPWREHNSAKKRMLQKEVEVVWRKLAREAFDALMHREDATREDFERLFSQCKEDDELTLAIASMSLERFA